MAVQPVPPVQPVLRFSRVGLGRVVCYRMYLLGQRAQRGMAGSEVGGGSTHLTPTASSVGADSQRLSVGGQIIGKITTTRRKAFHGDAGEAV